ncbi:MAG: hypothetical protein CL910_10960 [Deltaproteobacteria bacterium]|jgi:SAM-dependent methyltransferase|nr:hypothetical protein [Deltaproteobacteria bacterium]
MRSEDWDALAGDFDREVFDPVGTDLAGAIARALRKVGRVTLACDFGCGTGRMLPLLRRRAERVIGLDFAPELLRRARERVGPDPRVELRRADLGRPLRTPRGAALVTCVNVLLTPDDAIRSVQLRNLRNALRPGGHLLLVVPSLESLLWTNNRLIEWNRREGLRGEGLFHEGIETGPEGARDLLRGIVDQGGTATKHHLREELVAGLGALGMETVHEGRVVYPWNAYFLDPPRWLGEPRPWDWLMLAMRS